jgi:hypothetical protein
MGEGLVTVPLDRQGSFAWVEDTPYQRASSAIALDGGCVVCDPVDLPGLDDALAPIGPVLGVWTLLVRHRRDGAAVADRHGAPFLTPADVLAQRPPAGIEVRLLVGSRERPQEVALWLAERRLLVCVESVATSPFFLTRASDRLGAHPVGRLRPPRAALAGIEPEAIAVGHGPPLTDHAAEWLQRSMAEARWGTPRNWARILGLSVSAAVRRRGASRA